MCLDPHLNSGWGWRRGTVFRPSGKLFYWPFKSGTFFDLLCLFLSFVCYAFVWVCLFVPCGHLLWKGWHLCSRFWCLTVSLSLSHWYPGSGVVLDSIDSWSLYPYLLCWSVKRKKRNSQREQGHPIEQTRSVFCTCDWVWLAINLNTSITSGEWVWCPKRIAGAKKALQLSIKFM